MKILSIDPGSKCGWAIIEDAGIDKSLVVESGVQVFDLKRGESAGMRFIRFRKWLNDLMSFWKPGLVVFEQAHHRGGAATELCVGFVTRVMEIATEYGVNYTSCHSMTLKKWATGKGNADKTKMIEPVRQKFPDIQIIDDNHADAILLGLWAHEEYMRQA